MTPRELWKARKEYQDFTNGFKDTRKGKKVFRKHIYQEVYSRNQSAYWQYFKEQKKKKRKKSGKQSHPRNNECGNEHVFRHQSQTQD